MLWDIKQKSSRAIVVCIDGIGYYLYLKNKMKCDNRWFFFLCPWSYACVILNATTLSSHCLFFYFTLIRVFVCHSMFGIHFSTIYQIGDKFIIIHLLIIPRSFIIFMCAPQHKQNSSRFIFFFLYLGVDFGMSDSVRNTVILHHGIQHIFM